MSRGMQHKINTQALQDLEKVGFVLLTDKSFPNLVTQISGSPAQGSWWSHPKGNEIFNASIFLTQHKDVLSGKLISGKVTFIHRLWWPDLFNILQRNRKWQLDGLSPEGLELLCLIKKKQNVRSDDLKSLFKDASKVAKEIENRSLVYSHQIHTETGKHVRVFNTWGRLIKQLGVAPATVPLEKSYSAIEDKIAFLNTKHGGRAKLPWVGMRR